VIIANGFQDVVLYVFNTFPDRLFHSALENKNKYYSEWATTYSDLSPDQGPKTGTGLERHSKYSPDASFFFWGLYIHVDG
jgi:hypothetical protein